MDTHARCDLDHLLEVLWVKDTSDLALLHSLECQRGDQCSTNTASVLCREDLHRVLLLGALLGRPVENLTERLCASGLEVRILVEDGSIGTDVALLHALLGADRGDTTGRQAGGAGADELGGAADQLELRSGRRQLQLVLEEIGSLLQILKRVTRG